MKRWILALVMLGLSVVPALAETAVTTGMGYKKMLSELCALYKQESGKQLTEVYSGTIGQSLAQYKAGSGVSVFVSDRQTLEDSDVSFASFQPLGTAVLVLAWKKGLNVESPQDLQNPKIQSIGYPDKKGAIYGKAAERFLTQSGLRGPLKDKLRMFSTVPQVFSYLTTGELDAGFVNTAVVKAQGKSIGGSIDIQSGYDPIELVAAVVKGAEKDPEVEAFLTFLQSDKARSVYAKHGCVHNREPTCSANCCTTRKYCFRCGLP